ncbi:hypothetical protein [Bacillus piscicola]|uniref:hypothetical protein n=1 Tax=Bacillus piscicola TaxID=1632684 RepID=UPI001F09649A|nr:hypothetical protein [Bacillus piscicola]
MKKKLTVFFSFLLVLSLAAGLAMRSMNERAMGIGTMGAIIFLLVIILLNKKSGKGKK